MRLTPHKNSLPLEKFDFDKKLFHVDKLKPWQSPNLIKLWCEAARAVIARHEYIGKSNADQLIVYPRGGVLYERWEEGDLDITFYFNDWVYEACGGNLPYAAIVNRFISLADASGLTLVEEGYNYHSAAELNSHHDRFNQYPIHIRNNLGNTIELHIFDGPLSFISPRLMLEVGGIGFVYDPDGNYYGDVDALDVLNRYIAGIDIEDLIKVKLKDFVQTAKNLAEWIESIREAYQKLSRIGYGVYLSKYYRKPFVRAITLWRLVGDRGKLQVTIETLHSIEQDIRSGKYIDPYQRLDILEPFYRELRETFKEETHQHHLARVEEAIRRRIAPRVIRITNNMQKDDDGSDIPISNMGGKAKW